MLRRLYNKTVGFKTGARRLTEEQVLKNSMMKINIGIFRYIHSRHCWRWSTRLPNDTLALPVMCTGLLLAPSNH